MSAAGMRTLRIGIVDTGVNPWHSHVRGSVSGCRIFAAPGGRIEEDGDFSDPHGHGTAVAGIVREAFPGAHLFAVRVFETGSATYPSLVARGMLRAAAAQCDFVNVSLSVPPNATNAMLVDACAAVVDAGCVVVASARDERPHWLPASLPGVYAVTADDTLAPDDVRERSERRFAACGRPRDLGFACGESNFSGDSFACARALVHLARRRCR